MALPSSLKALVAALSLSSLAGCLVAPDPAGGSEPEGNARFTAGDDATGDPPAPPPTTMPGPVAPSGAVKDAVVHLYMRDRTSGTWYCTGTLVSPVTLVTAAHCVDAEKYVQYTVVAANARGEPRVRARSPRAWGGDYEDVANPDLGVLTLDSPVEVDTYAELTDVSADVGAGLPVLAAAIVRSEEDPEASFVVTDPMAVSSTVSLGYTYGFGTPMFSKGGDSGAGLFLVEDGKVTNKLIGVARQPEPDRELDHFTRVDADLLAWMTD